MSQRQVNERMEGSSGFKISKLYENRASRLVVTMRMGPHVGIKISMARGASMSGTQSSRELTEKSMRVRKRPAVKR
jgi:hypothetical protein